MLNIVLLMAGNGKEFKDAGYETPKPLLLLPFQRKKDEIIYQPMYKVVLWNLIKQIGIKEISSINLVIKPFKNFSKIIFDIDLRLFLKRMLKDENLIFPEINVLETNDTRGALVAAYEIDKIELNPLEELLILNCDQLVEFNEMQFKLMRELVYENNYATHMDDGFNKFGGILFHFNEKEKSNKWGYSAIQNGFVKGIYEKQPISSFAHTGHYYYTRVYYFLEAARKVFQNNSRVNGEFFLSPTYEMMLDEGLRILPFMVNKFVGLGIPEDYERYKRAIESKKA